jgi:hypothetical protein
MTKLIDSIRDKLQQQQAVRFTILSDAMQQARVDLCESLADDLGNNGFAVQPQAVFADLLPGPGRLHLLLHIFIHAAHVKAGFDALQAILDRRGGALDPYIGDRAYHEAGHCIELRIHTTNTAGFCWVPPVETRAA